MRTRQPVQLVAVRDLRRQRKALAQVVSQLGERLRNGCVREPWKAPRRRWLRWIDWLLAVLRSLLGRPLLVSRVRRLTPEEIERTRETLARAQGELCETEAALETALKRARRKIAFLGSPGATTTGEFYSEDWPVISLEYRRDHDFTCEECGRFAPDGHVHHVLPLSRGGTNDRCNLVFLCRACHAAKHPHMRSW